MDTNLVTKFKWLVFIVLVFQAFVLFFHKNTSITQDLGRHLKTGEIIVKTRSIPDINYYTYTHPNFPFTNHHWLSEAVFYKLHSLGGINILIIFKTMVLVLSVGISILLAFGNGVVYQKERGLLRLLVVIPISFLAMLVMRERTEIRPEIFGYLFGSIYLWLIIKKPKEILRWFPLILILQILWVNLHISFVFGVFIFSGYTGSKIIEGVIKSKKVRDEYIVKLLIVNLVFLAAHLINPHMLKGALAPFTIFENYGYKIVENQNIFFLDKLTVNPNLNIFKVYALIAFASLLLSFKKSTLFSKLMVVGFTSISIFQSRHFFATALFTFPFVVDNMVNFIETKSAVLRKDLLVFISCLMLLLPLYQIFLVMTGFGGASWKREFGLGQVKYLKDAAVFVKEAGIKGNMFNSFDNGSYIAYQLFPDYRTFVDGRPEAYPAEFFDEYRNAQLYEDEWDKLVDKYNIEWVFFNITDQTPWARALFNNLAGNPDWPPIYLDDYGIIFVRKEGVNDYLVDKFEINLDTFAEDVPADYSASSLSRLAGFFSSIKKERVALKLSEQALDKDPNACLPNYLIGKSKLRSDNIPERKKAQEYIRKAKGICFK